ncbi:MAG: family 43 glycosylhydrolase [Bacteroidales bacterium]|nr:family 43 glycosylhydrolase [Bacteroidales bacterium]MDT8433086.1 family 43 glycosylhydrolase [Bacteroidales bacterium]
MKQSVTILFGIFLLLAGTIACDQDKEEVLIWTDPPSDSIPTYTNPVFVPDLADPTIVRGKDKWFYAYGTENTWFEGIHRVTPIIKSRDLVNWEYVGDAFETKPSWKEGGIWAPDVSFYNEKYYLFYSLSTWGDNNPGIGLATSPSPLGPFVGQGKFLDSESTNVGNSIDPFFYYEGEGRNMKFYLFWGSFRGIYGIELNKDISGFVGDKFRIGGDMFEATYIYKKDGYYYFFGSSGSCCDGPDSKYRVMIARSANIKGPYLDKEGRDISVQGVPATLFLKGDGIRFVGPGHNGEIIVDDNGDEWFLYHAIEKDNPYLPGGATRRPLMLDKIKWDDEGWPYLEGDVPSTSVQEGPYFKK